MTKGITQHVETVVIGGGQAGLVMGYYLAQHDHSFMILDAGSRVGDAWRNRWDSLRLFIPAGLSSLPGVPFPAANAYFPTKDELADYLEAYADRFNLPVQLDTTVESLTRSGDRYVLEADTHRITADHVVVATGPYHHPNVPEFAPQLASSITQLHSSEYRNPDQLPKGDVLVVGAGNSGAEIAIELAAYRRVWLSGPDTGHLPKWDSDDLPRWLFWFDGRIFRWLFTDLLTVDTWIGRKLKARGQKGGDPLIRLTPDDLERAGVERVPRVEGVVNGTPRLDDGRLLDVNAVIWATGFRPDVSWIEVPGLRCDADGSPIHDRGVVEDEPGLYFLGLPFQRSLLSATLVGVGADARYIATHLRRRADAGETE
ncbi:flavin-containing monooxygenase [Haladaptatus salinisoli]|uniref:flavin-containing monooxygenase n=1 Tax=Haladaptatus salinisoli TaxID=2884876 RepID=UPI001D0A643B|nr:NAD(P)-binding domain-containing protein [Haladaptatus salinisoli]